MSTSEVPNTSVTSKAGSESLKAEANTLYQNGQYQFAYLKYSEAIKIDEQNAVLYANRAAASLAIKKYGLLGAVHVNLGSSDFMITFYDSMKCSYMDAALDAKKAVDIDSKYAKAWGRFATAKHALWDYESSVHAWKSALASLPKDESNFSPSDVKLKEQFEDGLKASEDGLAKAQMGKYEKENIRELSDEIMKERKLPWQRAEDMSEELLRNNNGDSSAWIILNAYQEFAEAVRVMRMTKVTGAGVGGQPRAIGLLTSAIMRDRRVFHMDSTEWLRQYNTQMQFEAQVSGAWPGGLANVQEKAPELLRTKGWDAVRRAFSITIRGWFMRGFLEEGSRGDYRVALQFYGSAVSALEWGEKTWRDVPDDDRGIIFGKTFIRGMKVFYLEAYASACKAYGPDSEFSLDKLTDVANAMIEEIKENPPTGREEWLKDRGFYFSFLVYPQAEAYATLAFVLMEKAAQHRDAGDRELSQDFFAESAEKYLKAASFLPKDEYKHILYQKVAFEAYWHQGVPLKDILPLCRTIREGIGLVEKIWEYSANMIEFREMHLPHLQQFEQQAFAGLHEGRFTFDTPSSEIFYFPEGPASD